MRVEFHGELGELEASLHGEADLVLRALRSAINAFARKDVELADEVIAFDDEIDGQYVRLQQRIESLLARQTPVAVDLRLVLAVLSINLHLERMGDYCVTIAKLAKLVRDLDVDAHELLASLDEMTARAEEMIRVALDSFAGRRLSGAETLVDLDELIDHANRRAVEDVLALGDAPDEREYGLRALVVSRCIERIGDHAVDIGEQTAYLITGEFREFTDASHPVLPQ
jgi:phosphate transport system protein